MQTIVYRGSSDNREFTQEDFKSLGIDHSGMRFPRGYPVDVSNQAYGILMGHPALAGEFSPSDRPGDSSERRLMSLVDDEDQGEGTSQVVETGIGGLSDDDPPSEEGQPSSDDQASADQGDTAKMPKSKVKRAG